MNRKTIELHGKSITVVYEYVDDLLWIHAQGETWTSESSKAKKKTSRSLKHSAASGLVRAPMPGKILKVMVKVGDKVTAHQTVAAMEAMKMEYSIRSAVDGTVKEVKCREGQQVALDELLVDIEEASK